MNLDYRLIQLFMVDHPASSQASEELGSFPVDHKAPSDTDCGVIFGCFV